MRFNSTFVAVLTASWTALWVSGCGWIQDRPKPASSLQSEAMNLKCVDTLPAKLHKLFEGNYTQSAQDQEELRNGWKCLDKTLYSFAEHTRGRSDKYYTQAELEEFANRLLPKEQKISSSFVDAIYRLKTSLLGGTAHRLTRSEVHLLRDKLNLFGEIIIPLSSHIKVLLAPDQYNSKQRTSASQELKSFLVELTAIFSDSGEPTSWKDVSDFVTELERFLSKAPATQFSKGDKKSNSLLFIKEQLPVFQYLKLMIVGGSEFAIEPEKWKPIFSGIANLYHAFLMASNSAELLENLNFAIESTSKEQQLATAKITAILKVLKDDDSLSSYDTVQLLADNWAKALVANSIFFPKSNGTLSIQAFASSLPLRRLSGAILDEVLAIDWENPQPEQLRALSAQVQAILDPNILGSGTSESTTFKISEVEKYIAEHESLFNSKQELEMLKRGIKLLQLARTLTLGKSSDEVPVTDLREMLSKATDVYLAWATPLKNPNEWFESVGVSLEALNRAPAPNWVRLDDLLSLLDQAQELVVIMQTEMDIPWNDLRVLAKSAFAIKATALGSSSTLLTQYELKTLASVWEPMRKGDGYYEKLMALGERLEASPFRSMSIATLFEQAQPVLKILGITLPSEVDAEGLGLLKSLVMGGSNEVLEKSDHSLYAFAAASAYRDLYPLMQSPRQPVTLDSNLTLQLKTGLDWWISLKRRSNQISWSTVKQLMLWAAPKAGYRMRGSSAESLLITLQHRLINGQKTPKPKELKGTFEPEQFRSVLQMVTTLDGYLQDLNRAYVGVDIRKVPVQREQIRNSVNAPEIKRLLDLYPPQIHGNQNTLHFPENGKILDRYYYLDIAYKLFCKLAVKWVFETHRIYPEKLGTTAPNELYLNLADATDLLEGINGFLMDFEVSFSPKSVKNIAEERFTTINVFTRTGNGNSFIEVDETVEFLSMTLGGQTIMAAMRKGLAEACAPNTPYRMVSKLPGDCLIKTYFSLPFLQRIYEPVMPQLIRQLEGFNSSQLEDFQKATLTTVQPGIGPNDTFYMYHVETLASLPQFIENLFIKMDLNQNTVLEFSELYREFPRFCLEIQKSGKGMLKGSCGPGLFGNQIEAVFGYIITKGEPPRGPLPTDRPRVWIKEAYKMLQWFATWKKMDKRPEIQDEPSLKFTRKDIIKMLSNLAAANLQPAPSSPESIDSLTRGHGVDELLELQSTAN